MSEDDKIIKLLLKMYKVKNMSSDERKIAKLIIAESSSRNVEANTKIARRNASDFYVEDMNSNEFIK